MAIVYEGERASGSTNAGTGTSHACPIEADCGAGNTVFLKWASRCTSTAGISVADDRGNTWTVDMLANGSNNLVIIASTRQDVGTLVTGDNITVTFGTAPGQARMWYVDEFSGLADTSYLDQTASATAASGTAITSGTTAATDTADELCIGAFCWGALVSFTKNAGYSAFTSTYQGVTPSSDGFIKSLGQEYLIVSSTGTQEAPASLAATTSWQGIIATFRAASEGPAPVAPTIRTVASPLRW